MSDLTGQHLDRYRILSQLGQGGMATVYKAYDTRLERDVAVKVIRVDQFATAMLDRILKRFEREAKSLAKLTHPNIVNINDYGEQGGIPYLVMVYLPGGTLKERLGKPIPWPESCKLLLPIAQALGYAHEQGLIHRDVKPSNILLTQKGQPMLTDFGIAKILETDETTALTGTGMGVGTPEYMPPEQWTGKTGPQSDQYSLGVVFYEMLTGRKPYTADTPAAILLKQATDPLPRPTQYVADLPEAVEKVLIKALARNPDDRYASMNDFSAALEKLFEGQRAVVPDQTSQAVLPTGTQPDSQATIDQLDATAPDSRISIPESRSANVLKYWPYVAGLAGLTLVLVLLGGLGRDLYSAVAPISTATVTFSQPPTITATFTPIPSHTFTPVPSATASVTPLPEMTATPHEVYSPSPQPTPFIQSDGTSGSSPYTPKLKIQNIPSECSSQPCTVLWSVFQKSTNTNQYRFVFSSNWQKLESAIEFNPTLGLSWFTKINGKTEFYEVIVKICSDPKKSVCQQSTMFFEVR